MLCRLVAPSAGEAQEAEEQQRARLRLEAGAADKGRIVALPQSDVTPGGEMGAAVLSPPDEEVNAVAEGDGAGAGPGLLDGAGTGDQGPGPVDLGPVDLGPVDLGAGRIGSELEEPAGAGEPTDEVDADEAVADDAGATAAQAEYEDEFEDEDTDDEEGTGELVYELAEWLPEQRVELSMLLESAGVAYNWDGSDLTVAEEHEDEVDGLFEQVHGEVEEDDEARYHSIEELFGAVDRLANDPGDEDRRRTLLETVGVVELPTPVGVDDGYWWRVRSQGHALVAAIEHGSRNDEVSREAALLAEMLHEMV